MPKERDESKLLHAMGFETANVHLGTRGRAKRILPNLGKRSTDWLHEAASGMVKATSRRLARMARSMPAAQTFAKSLIWKLPLS